jgi:hypothetical protein
MQPHFLFFFLSLEKYFETLRDEQVSLIFIKKKAEKKEKNDSV